MISAPQPLPKPQASRIRPPRTRAPAPPAEKSRPQAPNQIEGFPNRSTRTQNVIDDNRRKNVTFADVLAKLPLAVFDFRPVNLLGAQRFADAESDHNAARARTD